MDLLKQHIQAVIHREGKSRFSLLEKGLYLLSLIYGKGVQLRGLCYQKNWISAKALPCVVISIGNITSGGTGKTPLTIYVARLLKRLGYKVAVLSRGYKGEAEKTGGIVSDGDRIILSPDQAGDEPYMMANCLKNIPVIVGRNRYASGKLAVERFQADAVVLDDGYQHLKLMRDLNLLLLDYEKPFGNGYLIPRGLLREKISALKRADAVIFTRYDHAPADRPDDIQKRELSFSAWLTGKPLFKSFYIPHIHGMILKENRFEDGCGYPLPFEHLEKLRQEHCFAFSGIARNDDFKKTVESTGCVLTGFKGFPDHHTYSAVDLDHIVQMGKASGADVFLTTEKDAVRIPDEFFWPLPVVVIGLDVSFVDGIETFNTFLEKRIKKILADKTGH